MIKLSYIFVSTFIAVFISNVVTNDALGSIGSINYKSVNKPLVEFCQEISKQTSYNVIIDDEWQKVPISMLLKDAPVEDGIEIALKQLHLSHSLIIEPSKKTIKIYVANNSSTDVGSHTSESSERTHGQTSSAPPKSKILPSQSSIIEAQAVLNDQAVPPEVGVESITIRELSEEGQPQNNSSIDTSVVPPEEGVDTNVTEQQLLKVDQGSEDKNLDQSAVPPEDGVDSITERQLLIQSQEVHKENVAIEGQEDVPPEDDNDPSKSQ